MADEEPMTNWIRTFWRDDLESITEIDGRAVYPSQKDALEAAVHRVYVEGVPQKFTVEQQFDIVAWMNVVLIEWQPDKEKKDVNAKANES